MRKKRISGAFLGAACRSFHGLIFGITIKKPQKIPTYLQSFRKSRDNPSVKTDKDSFLLRLPENYDIIISYFPTDFNPPVRKRKKEPPQSRFSGIAALLFGS